MIVKKIIEFEVGTNDPKIGEIVFETWMEIAKAEKFYTEGCMLIVLGEEK
jgi:hypothetical protein